MNRAIETKCLQMFNTVLCGIYNQISEKMVVFLLVQQTLNTILNTIVCITCTWQHFKDGIDVLMLYAFNAKNMHSL